MQVKEIFLLLCLAHLAADFLLQTDAMVKAKKRSSAKSYLHHGAIHYVAILVIALAVHPSLLAHWNFQTIALALIVVHLLIDFCKEKLTARKTIGENVWVFLGDQGVHLLTIAAAAMLLANAPLSALLQWLRPLGAYRTKTLAVLVVYFAVVFAGGYLIRFLTRPLTRHLAGLEDEASRSLRNAGMYIGWLERALVLTAVLLRSPATVGLVLAAKSIARFPELGKSERFAEYFLIGTLLSLLGAIFGGMLLLKVLTGHINLVP
jgi:hypothetical protein